MPATSPVILILGSGPNVGQHVARAFAAKGYKVALASRSLKEEESTAGQLSISSDLSDPDTIVMVFSKVKALLGIPSVVLYNAGAASQNDKDDPLSLPLIEFTRDLNINTVTAFVAAQQAILGFKQLPDSASKTFIYTGNILNTTTIAPLMSLGVGKSATAHMIQSAASAYQDRGFKFYYSDERKADGSAAYFDISGEAHGKFYAELAEHKLQGPWQQTFVKGIGYKRFPAN
ncbi:putative short-chain dehydrogenase [Viridothelium virens]|uniref:Putative short-chain dehydrogenase n=1 Tax=Viridothelium virens TaxID=1048519 RepID=A0A6A6H090_VIRVR|nr:putative short-chain dehydrogenase [Viridothelium virens]